MAQHDYNIANGTGAAVRSDLNNALAAIVSQNSGATAPSTTYAYMPWADTTTGLFKIRNAANNGWITLYQLDGEWSTIALENGTAGAPSIYFKDSGTDTGIYSPGTDQVAISTGGTGRLFVDSSGRVGLGTSSPSARLSVEAVSSDTTSLLTSLGSANGSEGAIFLRGGSTAGFYYDFKRSGTTGSLEIQGNQTGFNNICLAPTSGRVGVGNGAPSDMLHIGTTSAGGNIRLVSSSYGNNGLLWFFGTDGNQKLQILTGSNKGIVYTPASIDFAFEVGNSEKARLTSDGKFLVGTSSTPADHRALFQSTPADTSGFGSILVARGTSTGLSDGSALGVIAFSDSGHVKAAQIGAFVDGGYTSGTDQPSRLVFSTTADGASSPTERMRIAQTGTMYTFVTGNSGNYFASSVSAGTSGTLLRGAYGATSNANDGAESIFIYTNGNITNANNSYTGISDLKLKENIVDAGSQWDDLKAFQVRKFNFKKGQTHTQIGLIAQEVELVSPGLVSESPDRDPEGNDLGTVTKSVNYSVLYMKAVKALQEAMERIEALEAKVAALETA